VVVNQAKRAILSLNTAINNVEKCSLQSAKNQVTSVKTTARLNSSSTMLVTHKKSIL